MRRLLLFIAVVVVVARPLGSMSTILAIVSSMAESTLPTKSVPSAATFASFSFLSAGPTSGTFAICLVTSPLRPRRSTRTSALPGEGESCSCSTRRGT